MSFEHEFDDKSESDKSEDPNSNIEDDSADFVWAVCDRV